MDKTEINYRKLFEGINMPITLDDGCKVVPINFDNGATTPPLKYVDKLVMKNILNYGSIGRGKGQKSSYCTNVYENSRSQVLDFFNADKDQYVVIYVKNTTDGLNLLANTLISNKKEKVLTTRMEHHANDLPWRKVANLIYIDVDDKGKVKIEDVEQALIENKGEIKYVTITGASNVTGYTNPINKIAELAHRYGAKIIVDAAQLVAHRAINMNGSGINDSIDYLVFSGHKMYAPYGCGVIIGLKDELNSKEPFIRGGGAVECVLDNDIFWSNAPQKFEAGTPNFLGVVALLGAMKILKSIGFDKIESHEGHLRDYLLEGLSKIPKVINYGDVDDKTRLGVTCFNVQGIRHGEIALQLAKMRGIAVREGCFCAHPYCKRLLKMSDVESYKYAYNPELTKPGLVRISLGLYNTEEELNIFLDTLSNLVKNYRK